MKLRQKSMSIDNDLTVWDVRHSALVGANLHSAHPSLTSCGESRSERVRVQERVCVRYHVHYHVQFISTSLILYLWLRYLRYTHPSTYFVRNTRTKILLYIQVLLLLLAAPESFQSGHEHFNGRVQVPPRTKLFDSLPHLTFTFTLTFTFIFVPLSRQLISTTISSSSVSHATLPPSPSSSSPSFPSI